jgi:hypothetical protein
MKKANNEFQNPTRTKNTVRKSSSSSLRSSNATLYLESESEQIISHSDVEIENIDLFADFLESTSSSIASRILSQSGDRIRNGDVPTPNTPTLFTPQGIRKSESTITFHNSELEENHDQTNDESLGKSVSTFVNRCSNIVTLELN